MNEPRYLVYTNGACTGLLLWDHGNIVGNPRPGVFVMEVACHRLPDLLKELGVERVEKVSAVDPEL